MALNTVVEKFGRSRVQTHETRYIWSIQNIRNCPFGSGEDYDSPEFFAGDQDQYTCILELYLNGYVDDDYVGIWPKLTNIIVHGDFKEVLVEISIVDEEAGAHITKRKYLSKEALVSRDDDDVFKKFAKKDELLKMPGFLARGDLKIVCSIYSYTDCDDDNDVAVLPVTDEKMNEHLADFEKLLFNEEFSDFQFIIGETKIPVHRAILAARSRVFSAMLSNDMLEKNEGFVTIEAVDVEVMRELLRFVYVGQVCNLGKIADKILIAADRYELNPLKQMCENILAATLSADSIFEILQLVDKHDAPTLKKAAIDYVMKNAKQLAEEDDFDKSVKQLSPDLSVHLMRGLITKN